MKKVFISISFLLFFNLSAISQIITLAYAEGEEREICTALKKTTIDTCNLSIQYYMTSVQDISNVDRKRNNFMILQIGNRISKFFDYYVMITDSLVDIYAEQKMDGIEAANKLLAIDQGTLPINIFKNYPENKITTYDLIPISVYYRYIDDKETFNWHLETGDTTILNYNCKKATTTYRGRDYTAWYTPEIPISDGPWKFWGLPGLILDVCDVKREYEFKVAAIEKSKWLIPIYLVEREFYKTTNKQFNKQLKYYYDNPYGAIESSGKIKGLPINPNSTPYNPIELFE
ncbi:MAG: GLPGLI family protein [Paludibacteraceae bacterium]